MSSVAAGSCGREAASSLAEVTMARRQRFRLWMPLVASGALMTVSAQAQVPTLVTVTGTRWAEGSVVLAIESDSTSSALQIARSIPVRLRPLGVPDEMPTAELPVGSRVGFLSARLSDRDEVLYIERRSGATATKWGTLAAEVEGWDPWYVRRHFDFGASDPGSLDPESQQLRKALLNTSRRIAAHFPEWRDRQLWLSGPADKLLVSFTNAKTAGPYTAKHGPRELLPFIEKLAAASRRAGAHRVNVRVTLARPVSSTHVPVGGGWLYFPLAVYLDDEHVSPLFESDLFSGVSRHP